MTEEWKYIEGNYALPYQVSSKGNVALFLDGESPQNIKISNKNTVYLKTNTKAHSSVKVDRLVCKAFVPRRIGIDGNTVIHKDGDKTNNSAENLCWNIPIKSTCLLKENYKIYAHISPSGKYYIGQTKLSTGNRWRQDGKGYKKTPVFAKAIKKYGWNNFQHVILEENIATQEEADLKEQEYIKKFNSIIPNGYNVETGGVRSKNKLGKNVICFDFDGNFVQSFQSIYYASLFVNKDRSSITRAIQNKLTCGQYFWCYKDDFSPQYVESCLKNYNGRLGRSIYQYDPQTFQLLNIFNSVISAAKCTNINRPDISSCLNNHNKTAGGYIWSYTPVSDFSLYTHKTNAIQYSNTYVYFDNKLIGTFNTAPEISRETNISSSYLNILLPKKTIVFIKGYIISYRKLTLDEIRRVATTDGKAVEQYDLNGNLIKTFRNIADACLEIAGRKKASSITAAATGYHGAKTAYGFIWKYAEPVL